MVHQTTLPPAASWRTPQAVYWISNTLLLSLDEKQMLAIARSVRAL